ncbi:MAG: sulfurtransferase [Acidobacteria bacterium]|nr:sulfurtransferase [Acidobacteriota bacterium]
MKKAFAVFYAAVVAACYTAVSAQNRTYGQREMDPLVSSEWLAARLNGGNLLVIDIRSADEYSKGHIPGSANVPTDRWWVTRNQLLLELPDPGGLRDRIGQAGIRTDSKVVLVNKVDTDFDRAHLPRVAWTLIYGGVQAVSILDGGLNKWISEGRPVSTDPFAPREAAYEGVIQEKIRISKPDLVRILSFSGSEAAAIIDSRAPGDFFGVSAMMPSSKSGHIPGAACLPVDWAFTALGAFRKTEELEAMAKGVVGSDRDRQIIVYCGVGGYAATWWYIFSEMLGYRNARVYDGSIQEWIMDPEAPLVRYEW